MGKFNGPSDTPRDAPIWVQRIRDLMDQNGMTQKELAEKCGCSTSSISKWVGINKRTEKSGFEKPKPDNMKAIADALGVSVDYLEGEDECKTPSDDEIRKVIGLSGKAVENLKKSKDQKERNRDISSEKGLAMLSYLAETIDKYKLLTYLYDFMLADFDFVRDKLQFGNDVVKQTLPSGSIETGIIDAEIFSDAMLMNALIEIHYMKQNLDGQQGEKGGGS